MEHSACIDGYISGSELVRPEASRTKAIRYWKNLALVGNTDDGARFCSSWSSTSFGSSFTHLNFYPLNAAVTTGTAQPVWTNTPVRWDL